MPAPVFGEFRDPVVQILTLLHARRPVLTGWTEFTYLSEFGRSRRIDMIVAETASVMDQRSWTYHSIVLAVTPVGVST
jgi:hypothetical protein